ncbi:MAG: hypothetical protein ACLVJH_18305 [Faecalibacterium prausnitzii]
MLSLPTARRSGISAATRWAAVYSRYANAAERETSQPECIVRRCFPVEKARRSTRRLSALPGGLNIFSDGRALRDMVQQRFFDERFARLAAVKGQRPSSPTMAASPSCVTRASG